MNEQVDLFQCEQSAQQGTDIELPNASMVFYSQMFTDSEANLYFQELLDSLEWRQEQINIHDKSLDIPRLSAWYGDAGAKYTYSGIPHTPHEWSETLLLIKKEVENITGNRFNSVLCNLYRHDKDSVAWHSDDEPELGKSPVIASVSLGATRIFELRRRDDYTQKYRLNLNSGSCLIMKGQTQNYWQHQIPKESVETKPRINLTFRTIL